MSFFGNGVFFGQDLGQDRPISSHRLYSSISFRKSTPLKNRQLIVYFYSLKYQVDGCVGELTLQNYLMNTFCHIGYVASFKSVNVKRCVFRLY